MKRGPIETRLSAHMGSVIMLFEFIHDFPIHRVCENGGREVFAQVFHGMGVDVLLSEDDRVFSP